MLRERTRAARSAATPCRTPLALEAPARIRRSRSGAILRPNQRQTMVLARRVAGSRRSDRRTARSTDARAQLARLRVAQRKVRARAHLRARGHESRRISRRTLGAAG